MAFHMALGAFFMIHSSTTSRSADCDLCVQVHWSKAEVEELRAFWTKEQHHPNSDLDHFLLVCRLLPEIISPCVFSVWREGSCRAVLAGRFAHANFQPRLGYLKLPRIRGRTITFIEEGVIGVLGEQESDAILDRINELLAEQSADMVVFNLLPKGLALRSRMEVKKMRALGVAKPCWSQRWKLKLQTDPGFLVKAMRSKHRSWVRRKERELEAAFPGRIAWKWHSQISEVGTLCNRMELVAARTYHRGLNAGFKDDQEHRERFSLFARQGNLRIMILEIGEEPAAYWLGIVYQRIFYSFATGFAPEFEEYEVGTQILLRLVDELVKEGVEQFDFGMGDANYKKRFGDCSWHEATVRLFGNSWRSQMLRAYVGSCEVVDRTLRSMVQRFGLTDRLKQVWRRRLAVRVR